MTTVEAEEVGTPVCGEMIFDVKKANHPDSRVKHECGEWRPMVRVKSGGDDEYDYSWHSPPPTYSGGTNDGEPTPTTAGSNADGSQPTGDGSVATVSAATKTQQVQYGTAPPESPAGAQRVNIFKNIQTPSILNPVGGKTKTKPQGYGTIGIVTWIRTSAALVAGQTIEMNFKIGLFDDDLGPANFYGQAMKLDVGNMTPTTEWKRLVLKFKGFDRERARVFTFMIERRNDVSNIAMEVWTLKHHFFYEV